MLLISSFQVTRVLQPCPKQWVTINRIMTRHKWRIHRSSKLKAALMISLFLATPPIPKILRRVAVLLSPKDVNSALVLGSA